jgi:hypothetical protein
MTTTIGGLIESLPAATGFPAERGWEIARALQAAVLLPSEGEAAERVGMMDAVRLLIPLMADAAPAEAAKISELFWSLPLGGIWRTDDRPDGLCRIGRLDDANEWVNTFVPADETFGPFLVRVLAHWLVSPDENLDPRSVNLVGGLGERWAGVRFASSPNWRGPSMQISAVFDFSSAGAPPGLPDDAPPARITRTAEVQLGPLIKALGDLLLDDDEKAWIDTDRKVRAALGGATMEMEGA